jgi:carboxypeptidase Taq
MGEHTDRLRAELGQITDISMAAALLSWDQQTYMPRGGGQVRAMQLSTLSGLAHLRFTSDALGRLLEKAKAECAGLPPESDDAGLIRKTEHDFNKETRVPGRWVSDFSRVTSLAHQEWEQARAENNFARFLPHLEEIVRLRREYAGFFAPFDHPYDPLLDDFEPGLKTARVKEVFDRIRDPQTDLVRSITESADPAEDEFLHQHFDQTKQIEFGLQVIRDFGFDFDRGRQDRSAHPFTIHFGRDDVRITTRVQPGFLGTALFGTLHEAGHALYEQGIDPALERTPLGSGASLAVHESQSRLWENLVGRSRAFWSAYLPRLRDAFPGLLDRITLDQFYRGINRVQPSLIRVEADEATYNLHIMIRFDLETALMQEELQPADLPEAWRESYTTYLGVTPQDDASGVLQDVHWSGGMIGYFPTYALGNIIASQLWEKIEAGIPDLEQNIAECRFSDLLQWLRENLHRHGSKFQPVDLLNRVVGRGIDAEPYLRYLKTKYGELFGL